MFPFDRFRDRGARSLPLLFVAAALLALSACDDLTDGIVPDTSPPNVAYVEVDDGDEVNAPDVTIEALAQDDRAVDLVRWSTNRGTSGVCTSLGSGSWRCGPVPLPFGDTRITIRAWDAAGNVGSTSLTLTRPGSTDPPPPGPSGFDIEMLFYDHVFTSSQLAAFEAAAVRWEELVIGDLESFPLDRAAGESCLQDEPTVSRTVDDLLIFVTSDPDGRVGGVLGIAAPCLSRLSGPDVGTNAVGYMEFDATDLAILEADGQLVETIVHEMGHVLGIGTNWEYPPYYDLLDYIPADDAPNCATASGFVLPPEFTGASAVAAWQDLGGGGWVPVEEDGGIGTQCGHWDEETFGSELMTGFLQEGRDNPLSDMTVASLEDIGLTVDRSGADSYALPLAPASTNGPGLDLAAREILLPPRGGIDPATGEVSWFEAP